MHMYKSYKKIKLQKHNQPFLNIKEYFMSSNCMVPVPELNVVSNTSAETAKGPTSSANVPSQQVKIFPPSLVIPEDLAIMIAQ